MLKSKGGMAVSAISFSVLCTVFFACALSFGVLTFTHGTWEDITPSPRQSHIVAPHTSSAAEEGEKNISHMPEDLDITPGGDVEPVGQNVMYASILDTRYFQVLTEEDVKTLNEAYNNYGCDIPFSTFEILVKEASKVSRSVAEVAPPDISLREIVEFYNLWSYIRSFTKSYLDIDTSLRVAASILLNSRQYNLPLGLVVGVAQTESLFKPTALSSTKARGVMQVMWKYHEGLLKARGFSSEKDLHDPEMGVAAGCIILSRYIKAEESIIGALGRYYGKLTKSYVGKVFAFWHAYEMYASGIIGDWRAMVKASDEDWGKLTRSGGNNVTASLPNKNAPPKESVTYVYNSVSGSSSASTSSGSAKQGSDSTTVYNRYGGEIKIRHSDGRVTVWRGKEEAND